MKVGILTWYDVLNYGSAFQAYALQKLIESFSIEPEILMHDRKMPDYYRNTLKEKNLRGLLKWFRNQTPNRRENRKSTKQKYNSFEEFRAEYLRLGEHYRETDADCVIIGSDQIFDINGMYYPFQFGRGISCASRTTYAPCFGETTLDSIKKNSHYEEICASINKLKNVNARDENTQKILKHILGTEVSIVLDPTLLYDFKNEKQIWNKRLIKEKYCIIYSWGGITTSEEFAEHCKMFARKHHLKLVSVGEIRKWCDIQYDSASPIDFFELFMHTEMVLTNMFHGTCFSIIMEKPFYSFVMPHNRNKLGGLLKYLNLETQMLESSEMLTQLSMPSLDYIHINKQLQKKREVSIEELEKSLGIK